MKRHQLGVQGLCCLLRARAVLLLMLGQRSGALRAFDAMLEMSPADAYALASKAQVLHQSGELRAAVDVQQRLCQAHPAQSSGWFNLAFMLQEAGDDAAAEPAFHNALKLQPNLDRAWYGLALSLIRLGRLDGADGAVQALKKNTALQPMSPFGWYQLARVQTQLGNHSETQTIIERLQRFEPRVAGQLRRELGEGAACN